MKILITGATGFIGSHLAEELHRRGHTIRCLIRKGSDLKWIKDLPVEYVEGDYADIESLKKAVSGVDLIYHAAGVTKSKTKQGYFTGNLTPTVNMLKAVSISNKNLKRFIHISSGAATGPNRNSGPIREDADMHPITSYGVSKMEAEKECRQMMETIPITIVRPPAVYGPRDRDVFEFFNTIGKGLQPMIGFKDTYVSLIHAKDLVNGIILAGENAGSAGKTYYISSERYYNWKELGQITAKVMNKKVVRLRIPKFFVYIIAAFAEFASIFSSKPALINFEKARDMVQDAWTFSVEKAQRELGFKEKITIEDGIRDTVNWYREHKWLK